MHLSFVAIVMLAATLPCVATSAAELTADPAHQQVTLAGTQPSAVPVIARCVIAVMEVAPCQCLAPGGHHTTSPGRIVCMGFPHSCVSPTPAVTTRYCPLGCVCHADRAPGSKVT